MNWWARYRQTLLILVTAVVTLASFVGILWKLDNRWAKVEQVRTLELRLDQKILSDRISQLQMRIWDLERHYRDKPMPPEVSKEYHCLKAELEQLKEEYRTLLQHRGGEAR